jgi:hypothetical protein
VSQTIRTDGGQPLFSEPIRTFAWGRTAVAGAATWVAEYVVVALLFVFGPASLPVDTTFERLVGYAFRLFGAHFAPVVISTPPDVQLTGPSRINVVTAGIDPVPSIVFLSIPVVALLVAGAAVERWRRDTDEGLLEGSAIVGMGLAGGYVIAALVASFVFVATTPLEGGGTATEAVDRLAAVLTPVGYPLLLGTVGAFAVRAYRSYA